MDVNYVDRLKKEKDFAILSHYYVDGEVQEAADYVGDSFYLAKAAVQLGQSNILFAGVSFMGESAKILNPSKHVYMADDTADCPMAHMASVERVEEIKKEYGGDVAVVCYINSTAELKAASDVCVTSSNAVKVVKNLPNKKIYFIPDANLGRYVAKQVPEKEFIFCDGFCHVHKSIEPDLVRDAKKLNPDALVLAHPECGEEVLDLADYVGSTAGILDFATKSDEKKFIICTEMGIFFQLGIKNPDKKFFSVGHRQFCPNMKKITLKKAVSVMENPKNEVTLDAVLMEKARVPLERMLELAK